MAEVSGTRLQFLVPNTQAVNSVTNIVDFLVIVLRFFFVFFMNDTLDIVFASLPQLVELMLLKS